MKAVAEFLFGLRWEEPPLVVTAVIIVLAVLAHRSHRRRERRYREGSAFPPSGRRLTLMGLVVAGPPIVCGAQLVSYHLLYPAVHAVVWPPIAAGYGLEDGAYRSHVGGWVFGLEDVLAGTLATTSTMAATGWLVGKVRAVMPLDGYWLANPASIVAGHVLGASLFGEVDPLEHWGLTLWALRGIVMCPIYAWLFFGAAAFSRGPGGLTRA